NSRTASSITPRPVIRTSSSIGGGLPLPPSSSAPVLPPPPTRPPGGAPCYPPARESEQGGEGLCRPAAPPARAQPPLVSPAHPPPRRGREAEAPPPIAPHTALDWLAGTRRGTEEFHREHRPGRDHHGPGEQRVRADGHHQQRLHLWPHDRAARRIGVGGRPRGG